MKHKSYFIAFYKFSVTVKMKTIELSEEEVMRLRAKDYECDRLRKRFLNLEKDEQELLVKIERYEKALKQIAWGYSDVNPLAGRMQNIARKAL